MQKTQLKPDNDQRNHESVCAYAFLKLGRRQDLIAAIEQIYFQENVLYCDAVEGDFDLVILLQGDSYQAIEHDLERSLSEKLKVTSMEFWPITSAFAEQGEKSRLFDRELESGEQNGASKEAAPAQSYLLIEVTTEIMRSVYRALSLVDAVATCDLIENRGHMILLLEGPNFDAIDRLIAERIRLIPGVLRTKQFRIIKLFQL